MPTAICRPKTNRLVAKATKNKIDSHNSLIISPQHTRTTLKPLPMWAFSLMPHIRITFGKAKLSGARDEGFSWQSAFSIAFLPTIVGKFTIKANFGTQTAGT